jgi:hypothetical protein
VFVVHIGQQGYARTSREFIEVILIVLSAQNVLLCTFLNTLGIQPEVGWLVPDAFDLTLDHGFLMDFGRYSGSAM